MGKIACFVYLGWLIIVFMYNPKDYITSFKSCLDKIIYICRHKKAYLMIMKKYKPNRITLRGLLHDCDKLMILIFMLIFCPMMISLENVSEFHKNRSHHHHKAITDKDYYYQIIDYESARYTKSDKPMTAREYIEYKHIKNQISNNEYNQYIRIMHFMGLN